MSFRSFSSIAFIAACLASSSASAGLIGVTSYDMNNGNGTPQFTGPTGGQDYFDFSYTKNGESSPTANASKNGSNSPIPYTGVNDAPLTGGKGMLTDGVISSQNFSLVSGSNGKISNGLSTGYYGSLNGQPTQYVGWKYQDPTIVFHLASNQTLGQISVYVASDGSGGLVGAPHNVGLTIGGVLLSSSDFSFVTSPYADSISTIGASVLTIKLNHAYSSNLAIALQLFRGPLQQDGYDYYNQYQNTTTGVFGDPQSGFLDSAYHPNLEPWIMLSEVQFLTAAVPEPSTWIMMIAGFFGIGTLAYRRRRELASA